jgi:diguanylate cyclase (GGDEF)-like protein
VSAAVLLAVITLPNQLIALYIAFVVVVVFSSAMLWLGVDATRRGRRYAPYFLSASIASALGTAITALVVWGIMPFTEWGYHGAEYGMAIDATLLAFALGKHFREMQRESLIAVHHAARDPLTELYNRRSFLEMAEPIWERAESNARPLSLVIFDLDHFKSINDSYGHSTGDAVLIAVAKVLVHEIRNGDIIARWGGEEFLLLLPDTEQAAAIALAERLRNAIAEIRVPVGDIEIALTASSGVANKARHSSLNELITEADDLLYRAKREGRNRVCFAPQEAG